MSINETISREAAELYATHKVAAGKFTQAKSDADYFSGQVRSAAWEAAGEAPVDAEASLQRATKIGERIVPA